jgi:hypothetical protein
LRLAAKAASTTIPVVIATAGDPFSITRKLAQPPMNMTGPNVLRSQTPLDPRGRMTGSATGRQDQDESADEPEAQEAITSLAPFERSVGFN